MNAQNLEPSKSHKLPNCTSPAIRRLSDVTIIAGALVREAVGDREPAVHEAALYDLRAKYAEAVALDDATAYLHGVGGNG